MTMISDNAFCNADHPALSANELRTLSVYAVTKRVFDLVFSLAVLLPLTIVLAAFLMCLNPVFNPGPLLYRQARMGRNQRVFQIVKFRSMTPEQVEMRGPVDGLEGNRITPLGHFLRRSRLDELPQIFNVVAGEMSLIGPRPDAIEHAVYYRKYVAGYAARHAILPGISGQAQIEIGYADDIETTTRKTLSDLDYIRRACWRLDLSIFCRTILEVVTLRGA